MSFILLLISWFHGFELALGIYLLFWIQKHQKQKFKVKLFLLRHIRIFSYVVILIFFLRIGMYAICGVVMKGKVPNYATISE